MSRSRAGTRAPGAPPARRRPTEVPPARDPGTGAGLVWLPWLLVAFAALLRFAWPHPLARTPDETLFTQYARDVARHGPGAVASFVAWCCDHPGSGVFPWPQRVGYVWITGALLAVTGSGSVGWLVGLSSAASLLVMTGVAWITTRLANPATAALAVLFLALSPLDRAIAGRVWQDDVLAVFTTGLWIVMVLAGRRPGDRRVPLVFGGLAALAMLIKETALPAAATGTLYLMWRSWRTGRDLRGVGLAAGAGLAALLVAGGVITLAAGGPEAVRRVIELARIVNVPNEYMRTYQSGSPLYYVEGLLRLQPGTFVLAGAAVLLRLLRRWPSPGSPRPGLDALLDAATWMTVGYGLVAALYPQKNMRFLAPLFAPAAVLAAALFRDAAVRLAGLAGTRNVRWVALAFAVGLGAMAVADLALYQHWFVVRAVPDLATPWFRR